MKLILLLLISINVYAENWISHSNLKAGKAEGFTFESDCEKIKNEKCYNIGQNSVDIYSETTIQRKSSTVDCLDESNCDSIFASFQCGMGQTPIKNYDLLQVYCVHPELIMEVDAAKVSTYQAAQAIKTALATQEQAIASALRLIECGKRVKALMLVRNSTKNLTTAQVKQIVSTYQPIAGLLDSGSLASAKEEIAAVIADGVLITNGDKAALVSEIDSCKGGS